MQISPQKICLSYTLSVSDYRALQWSHGLYGIPRRHLIPSIIVLALLMTLVIQKSPGVIYQSSLIPLILIVPLWIIFHRYLVRSKLEYNPMFNTLITSSIDRHSFHMRSEHFDYRLWWIHVHRVVEGKRHFFIYESNRVAQILPKKVMTDGQLRVFKDLVRGVRGLDVRLK